MMIVSAHNLFRLVFEMNLSIRDFVLLLEEYMETQLEEVKLTRD